jgi:hypothetical protein
MRVRVQRHRQYTERPPPVNKKPPPRQRLRRRRARSSPEACSALVGGALGVSSTALPSRRRRKMAGLTGLEPATSCVTGRRSNQLNYNPAGRTPRRERRAWLESAAGYPWRREGVNRERARRPLRARASRRDVALSGRAAPDARPDSSARGSRDPSRRPEPSSAPRSGRARRRARSRRRSPPPTSRHASWDRGAPRS